jgi:hypothetical protein
LLVLLGASAPLSARPGFLEQFLADPLRDMSVEGCGTCHENPLGGGPRNPFGLAFAEEQFRITPMLRASFPDRFVLNTAQLADESTLYFSDPQSEYIVLEKAGEKRLINLVGGDEDVPGAVPSSENRFSFFVTSVGTGEGGNLGSLAGADRHCQSLAEAVGHDNKTWRAYLSTTFEGQPVIAAGDRIGAGPWYNIKGVRIARGVVDLHRENSNLNARTAFTEKGELADLHDVLTGTLSDGAASELTCNNWTSSRDDATTWVGHFDRQGDGAAGSSWNSAHASRGCRQESLQSTGGAGLFYCFAID